jgi:hypothetical protein
MLWRGGRRGAEKKSPDDAGAFLLKLRYDQYRATIGPLNL